MSIYSLSFTSPFTLPAPISKQVLFYLLVLHFLECVFIVQRGHIFLLWYIHTHTCTHTGVLVFFLWKNFIYNEYHLFFCVLLINVFLSLMFVFQFMVLLHKNTKHFWILLLSTLYLIDFQLCLFCKLHKIYLSELI